MRTSNFGQTNALTDLDEVVVPLVVNTRKDKDGNETRQWNNGKVQTYTKKRYNRKLEKSRELYPQAK